MLNMSSRTIQIPKVLTKVLSLRMSNKSITEIKALKLLNKSTNIVINSNSNLFLMKVLSTIRAHFNLQAPQQF